MTLMKIILLILGLSPVFLLAQKHKQNKKDATAITAIEALESSNPKTIAAFIKANPADPKTPLLKSKLINLLQPKKTNHTIEQTSNNKNITKKNNSFNNKNDNEVAHLLDHLFSSDTNKKEAFVRVSNKSNCDITVSFSGRKKSYTLNVPKLGSGNILIEKGEYMISSTICKAKYATNKSIQKDLNMSLGNN